MILTGSCYTSCQLHYVCNENMESVDCINKPKVTLQIKRISDGSNVIQSILVCVSSCLIHQPTPLAWKRKSVIKQY
jgi:hypothetical protein